MPLSRGTTAVWQRERGRGLQRVQRVQRAQRCGMGAAWRAEGAEVTEGAEGADLRLEERLQRGGELLEVERLDAHDHVVDRADLGGAAGDLPRGGRRGGVERRRCAYVSGFAGGVSGGGGISSSPCRAARSRCP